MSEAIGNAIRGEAQRVAAMGTGTRYGVVTSYDPDNYAVKVKRMPEGVETGWMPVSTPWAGDGWGLFAPPVVGAQVKLEHQEDGNETPLADGVMFSDGDAPRVPDLGGVPGGEFWLVHKTGTRLRLRNDSDFEIQHKTGSRMRFREDSTAETVHRDGGNVRMLPDGSVIMEHKDGSRLRFFPDGQIEVVHTSGSRITLFTNGGIELLQAGGSRVQLLADGTVNIRAPSIQAAADGGAVLPLVHSLFVALFNSHVHGNSGPPTPLMTAAHLTDAFRAR